MIALFTFGMGAGKIFKTGTPMYWQPYGPFLPLITFYLVLLLPDKPEA